MRFMHIADVHLGAAPDYGYPWAKERGAELWESFRRCMEDADEKGVDLLLIAGDLFHRTPVEKELDEVNELFRRLEHTTVVLIAGDSDYLQPDSPYLTYPWNANVITIFSDRVERIRIPELRTEIYGMSYHSPEIRMPVYDRLRAAKSEYFKILLVHGGDETHIPISKEALRNAGYDYAAMGHRTRPQVFLKDLAAYAGSPEPFEDTDNVPHGYIIGDVQKKKVRLTFSEVCSRMYRRSEIAVTEQDNEDTLRSKIGKAVQIGGVQNIYRIVLTGTRRPEFHPDLSDYLKCGRILEIEDHTIPAFHPDELRRTFRGGLIGRYIESFGEKPRGETEELALQYGLEALLTSQKDEGEDGSERTGYSKIQKI